MIIYNQISRRTDTPHFESEKQRDNHIKAKKKGYRRTVEGLQDLFVRFNKICPNLKNIDAKIIIDVLNELYHDDWDIEVINKCIYVELYYPEIVICKSNQYSHTIRDLFVTFALKPNSHDIYLTRTSLTPSEVINEYFHSHCQGEILRSFYPNMLKLCLGESNFSFHFRTSSAFKSSLMFLDAMLKTESSAFAPYRYIANLYSSNTNEIEYMKSYIDSYIVDRIYSKIIDFNIYASFSLIKEGDRIQLIYDKQYERFLNELILSSPNLFHYISGNKSYLVTQNTLMKSYSNDEIKDKYEKFFLNNDGDKHYTYFRDKKIFFDVVNENKEEIEEKDKEIRIYLNHGIKEVIENFAILNYIKNQKQ